jgi:hypothetical protein
MQFLEAVSREAPTEIPGRMKSDAINLQKEKILRDSHSRPMNAKT